MSGEPDRPQVSWMAIEADAEVVAAGGDVAGRVSRVVGDADADVFSGLAVVPHALAGERFVDPVRPDPRDPFRGSRAAPGCSAASSAAGRASRPTALYGVRPRVKTRTEACRLRNVPARSDVSPAANVSRKPRAGFLRGQTPCQEAHGSVTILRKAQARSSARKRSASAATMRSRIPAASSSESVRSGDWNATRSATDLRPSGIWPPR